MILKGTAVKSASHAVYLGRHLVNATDNEICEIWDIEGHARPDDLKAALNDFYETCLLTKGNSKTGLFMVSINPEKGQVMNKDLFLEAVSKVEQEFNLAEQPRAMVYHRKPDERQEMRGHLHVVWQTTDLESRKNKAQIWQFKNRCKLLARDLEKEFQHRVISNEPSQTSYSDKEREQSKRTDEPLGPSKRKKAIQIAYEKAKDSDEFIRRMGMLGFTVAKGKVGICLIDRMGQVYNLEKELKGKVVQADLIKRFEGLAVEDLPDKTRETKPRAKAKSKEEVQREPDYLVWARKREEFEKLGLGMTEAAKKSKEWEDSLDRSQQEADRLLQKFRRLEEEKERKKRLDDFRRNL